MAYTQMQRIQERIERELVLRSHKPGHEDRMNVLMREFIRLQGVTECEHCNAQGADLSEPIAMPSGKVKRVCGVCLAELKRVNGRPIYTRR